MSTTTPSAFSRRRLSLMKRRNHSKISQLRSLFLLRWNPLTRTDITQSQTTPTTSNPLFSSRTCTPSLPASQLRNQLPSQNPESLRHPQPPLLNQLPPPQRSRGPPPNLYHLLFLLPAQVLSPYPPHPPPLLQKRRSLLLRPPRLLLPPQQPSRQPLPPYNPQQPHNPHNRRRGPTSRLPTPPSGDRQLPPRRRVYLPLRLPSRAPQPLALPPHAVLTSDPGTSPAISSTPPIRPRCRSSTRSASSRVSRRTSPRTGYSRS